MRDDQTIDRSLDLDVPVEEAAALVTTGDGWRTWLVDEVELAVGPDGAEAGRVVDDGVERAVRIEERTERSVRFTWWEAGDDAGASEVVIRVHPSGTGSRVEIGERRLSANAAATATVAGAAGLARWQMRACLLSIVCTSFVHA